MNGIKVSCISFFLQRGKGNFQHFYGRQMVICYRENLCSCFCRRLIIHMIDNTVVFFSQKKKTTKCSNVLIPTSNLPRQP